MGSVRTIGFALCILMFFVIAAISPAILMRIETTPFIYTDISYVPEADVGLVLGASVVQGKPSPALEARTEQAVLLYNSGKVNTLLATGAIDGKYDEITPMREYLIEAGVPESLIETDAEGYDTYSSISRARHLYQADSLIIVSQDFHLPRAVFIARTMHIEAYGLVAPRGGRLFDYFREIPASWKALWDLLTGQVPTQSVLLAPLAVAQNRT
jgi:SanA protein